MLSTNPTVDSMYALAYNIPMSNKEKICILLTIVALSPLSFASAQTKYQTNCFSPYTTNPDNGKTKTITLTGSDDDIMTVSFIDGPASYPLLDEIDLSAPTGSIPPCEDRQSLGYTSATMGYNDAYITTSQGDIQLGYPKNVYANEANSIRDYVSGEYTIRDYTGGQYYNYVGFNLTPPFNFVGNSISDKIANENKIIREIAYNQKINIRIGSSGDMYTTNDYAEDTLPIAPVTVSVPATNCVHMSGTGPKSIVFMRDSQWSSSGLTTGDFLNLVQKVSRTMAMVSPYAENFSKLSFYADLLNIDTSSNSLLINNYTSPGKPYLGEIANSYIRGQSSCGGNDSVYVFINGFILSPEGNFSSYSWPISKNIYMGIPYSDLYKKYKASFKNSTEFGLASVNTIEQSFAYGVMHELGHALGGLSDEYDADDNKAINTSDPYTNCSPDPFDSFSYEGYMYGSDSIKGCFLSLSKDARPMYRPSKNSLMNSDEYDSGQKYNIVSCAHVDEALNLEDGEAITVDGAKKYFPACQKMDTLKDGYKSTTPSPQISNIDGKSIGPNQTVTIKVVIK